MVGSFRVVNCGDVAIPTLPREGSLLVAGNVLGEVPTAVRLSTMAGQPRCVTTAKRFSSTRRISCRVAWRGAGCLAPVPLQP